MFWYVILALLAAVIAYGIVKDRRYAHIPGLAGLPIVGRAPWAYYSVLKCEYLERLLELHEKYNSVFQIKFLGPFGNRDRMIHISDLEDLKHFFLSPNFEKGVAQNEILNDIFGDGIFNADGDKWRVQRQTASSLFHFNNLQAFVPIFHERAKYLRAILHKAATAGKPVELQQQFMRYTMDSIGELGFGINIDSLAENEDALRFSASFDTVQYETAMRFPVHPLWRILPKGSFKRHMENVDNFMKNIIQERKKEVEKGIDISGRTDLASKFVSAKGTDGKPMFDDQYVLNVLKNFLIAGRDTTAICLTWTIYELTLHPEVEAKLLKEIEEVVGENMTYENLGKLKYMRHVIDESLRLHPPVPVNLRCTIKDDVLPSGYSVPAGSSVSYAPYAIHRLAKYWDNPLVFNPERWETDTIRPFQFIPFHGGPRICLGQNMAYEEVKVALCTLLPHLKFTLVDPSSVKYVMSLTMPTKNGLHVRISPR